jgi:hypothetical protein
MKLKPGHLYKETRENYIFFVLEIRKDGVVKIIDDKGIAFLSSQRFRVNCFFITPYRKFYQWLEKDSIIQIC